MWIFKNDAYLSLVEHNTKPWLLMVRARFKGDIERTFPDATVICTPSADYRYRAVIRRDKVAEVISQSIFDIDYDNFKDSVDDDDRHMTYLRCWTILVNAQEEACGESSRGILGYGNYR